MTVQSQPHETPALIEELDHDETLEIGGGLNVFDDLYAYLKRTPAAE